jgi:hypothetical protein
MIWCGVAFRQWATAIIKQRQRLLDDYKKRTDEAARIPAGFKNVELLAHQHVRMPAPSSA